MHHAIEAIKNYSENKTIMNFVTTQAREKVAQEIRAEFGGGTTAKAVELLEIRNNIIKDRVKNYVASGLIGCYMASIKKNSKS